MTVPAAPDACLDEAAVLAYLDGVVDAAAEGHVAECAACRALVRLAATGAITSDASTAAVGLEATALDVEALVRIARPGLAVGARLGRYRIGAPLGRGGMGAVYAAHDPRLDRQVAIKLLHDARAGAQLEREGRAIARLTHPNVVAVYDVDITGDPPFVAMELVDGGTLDDWLKAAPRSTRDRLSMFAGAGAGLVAAHAAGVVHRDFKPANVLVGTDGRPRISDFGLAIAATDGVAIDGTPGTPAYMAPEQFDGGAVDARADQFSFAVALWESLAGARPFVGTTAAAIRTAISAGPQPPPTKLPTRVERALRRALAEDPAARFASMAALLRALAPPRRTVAMIAGVGGALIVVAVVTAIVVGRADRASVCRGLDRGLVGVWDPERRAEVVEAFARTGGPAAAAAADATAAALDRYAAAWRTARVDTCEAAQVRREQTATQQALRTVCLDERLTELRAVVDVLVRPDAEVIANAHPLVAGLTSIAACDDLRTLTDRVAVIGSPSQQHAIAQLRGQLVEVRARVTAGQLQQAAVALPPLQQAIDAAGYRPLQAEAALVAGLLADMVGRPREAERALRAAVLAAEAGRDDRTLAAAWLALARVDAESLGAIAAASDALAHGAASVERLGVDLEAQAELAYARAQFARTTGDFAIAREGFEQVAALWARTRLRDSPTAMQVQLDLAGVLATLGDDRRAREVSDAAVARLRGLLGAGHAELGIALVRASRVALRRWDIAAARRNLDEADQILRDALGTSHPRFADLLVERSQVAMQEEDFATGRALLEQARAIYLGHYGEVHPLVADVDRRLIHIGLRSQDPALARAGLDRATAAYQQLGGRGSAELLTLGGLGASTLALEGKGREAEAAARAHVAAREATPGPRTTTADAYGIWASTLEGIGATDEALSAYARATEIAIAAGGPNEPTVASFGFNHGWLLMNLGRHGDAAPVLERALAVAEHGPTSTASTLNGIRFMLAAAYRALGTPARGVPLLEVMYADPRVAANPLQRDTIAFWLGVDLAASGGDQGRARALVEGAHRGLVSEDPTLAREAAGWLRAHRT